jgi:hypothetical protein
VTSFQETVVHMNVSQCLHDGSHADCCSKKVKPLILSCKASLTQAYLHCVRKSNCTLSGGDNKDVRIFVKEIKGN